MDSTQLIKIRWGILGTGWVSTRFTADLFIPRPNVHINHQVTALGTSSTSRGETFISTIIPSHLPKPKIYTDYSSVYTDPEVDIVYIGTPHALHKEECLAAIAAGKHVLCEKSFTINEREALEVIAAAKAKNVYIMEAVWTRFFPLVNDLKRWLHSEKVIGDIRRMFCDFSLSKDMDLLPPTQRYKDVTLGGGALLDIGIYPLMWSNIILDGKVGSEASTPQISSTMVVIEGVDYEDVIVVKYPERNSVGILTASLRGKGKEEFCKIEGSKGIITLIGPTSCPRKVRIEVNGEKAREVEFNHVGMGFYFEADAVAMDILAGGKENKVVPLEETVRMMRLMDGIRREGGVAYPQDKI